MTNKKLFQATILIGSFLGLLFIARPASAAFIHPHGSVVINQGTIYRVAESGQALEGFDSPEKYFSYRYSFAEAAPATTDDLNLPRTVIAWGDGRLFVEQGVAFQVSGSTKHGFVSQEAFEGQGFKFSQAKVGTLNLPVGSNIESATQAHLSGSFVIDPAGAVWYVTDTERRGVATVEHLSSWGLGFNEVVPANANDLSKNVGALLPFRSGSLINDQGAIWVIEGNTKRAFPSAACFTNFGFDFKNVRKGSTQSYLDQGIICGPGPALTYERKTVSTSRGNFTVDILVADLNSGQIKVVTDTANDNDCLDNCPVKSLLTYVSENQGLAGINGSYFCPASYPECAGKTNSFYWKVYNSELHKMINPNNNIKEDKPFMAFDSTGAVRFFARYQDLISSGLAITAGISNEPLLVQNSQIVVTENILDDKERTVKSTRGGLGMKGQTVYAVVAHSATVMDLASIMQAIGAENAFNLDGGGSSALVYSGAYKVGPGRNIPNALIFVKK